MTSKPAPARVQPSRPDPKFQAGLIRALEGHPLETAARAGRLRLGLVTRDRPAAEQLLAEIEADPTAFRARMVAA